LCRPASPTGAVRTGIRAAGRAVLPPRRVLAQNGAQEKGGSMPNVPGTRVAGFTLIELMFVLALLGIVLSIGAPAMQTMVINNRISTAAGDLMSDFTFARATAISRSRRVGICASADQATCNGASWQNGWIIYIDLNANGAYDPGTEAPPVRVHEALASGLTMTPSPNALFVTFRPSGPADAARTFVVCKTGYKGRNIALNATGRAVSTAMTSNCS
jgi:prepilin-type N-terminal cleavage/methylation domain-containing protein